MKLRHLLLSAGGSLAACVLFAAQASAQVTVVGGGLGKECYEAVATNTTFERRAEEICDLALSSTSMSSRDRAATLVNRAILRMRGGRLDASEADLVRARSLTDDLPDLDMNLAALRLYQGRAEEALVILNTVLEAGVEDAHAAYYNRAIAQERLGDVTAAYYDYKKALELRPGWQLAEAQLTRFTVTSQ